MPGIFATPTIRAGNNAKTTKGDKAGEYKTAIMYLAPHTAAGAHTMCAMAVTAQCAAACLYHEGRARVHSSINQARIAKTKRYLASRAAFMAELVRDIAAFERHCSKLGVKPAVRLNGTSDVQWEIAHPCVKDGVAYPSIMAAFPGVQFYDYTKIVKRAYRKLPANYSLTLSYSGANAAYADSVIDAALATGANVAVVYRTKALRNALVAEGRTHLFRSGFGFRNVHRPIIDGDKTDMRFTDARGVIVGLYAKGQSHKDRTGFVLG